MFAWTKSCFTFNAEIFNAEITTMYRYECTIENDKIINPREEETIFRNYKSVPKRD